MTNNELLSGISDLLDRKLFSALQPIKDDIHVLKEDVAELKEDVSVLKEDVAGLKEDVSVLQENFIVLEDKVQSISDGLHQVKLCQENIIIPRLDTIESCYTDTYRRYQSYGDKMDSVFTDVDLLKKTVSSHSEKLQKLA